MWLEIQNGTAWDGSDASEQALKAHPPCEQLSFGPDRFFTELITRSSTEAVAKPDGKTAASLESEAVQALRKYGQRTS